MISSKEDSSRLSASHLTSAWRTPSFTSLNSDTRSFHTATPSPIDLEERDISRTPSPNIPTRSSSQIPRVNRTKTNSPIPAHIRSSNTGIVTRSPSKRSHTPFPYAVSHGQKMERTDSGFEDGQSTRTSRDKGRRSPLSKELTGKVKEMEKVGSGQSRGSSVGRTSSNGHGSGTASRTSTSSTRHSPATSTSTSTSERGIKRQSPARAQTFESKSNRKSSSPQNITKITRSTSYQIPTKSRSTHNPRAAEQSPEVSEVRLSNLRSRHCFYQFPPLPSSPPGTARKGSVTGEEYAIPPMDHPYHLAQALSSGTSGTTTGTFNTSRMQNTPTYHSHSHTQSLDLPPNPTTSNTTEILEPEPEPQPPQTTLYFLSPETRRLEYAAIDAASQGIRGLVSKLVPDCMMPKPSRRGFHGEGADSDGEAGSVRRYRLVDLDGGRGVGEGKSLPKKENRKNSGSVLRRWVDKLKVAGRR